MRFVTRTYIQLVPLALTFLLSKLISLFSNSAVSVWALTVFDKEDLVVKEYLTGTQY
jgi:hypothetical protein